VLLVAEKRIQSPLMEAASVEKIMTIESHVACAMSGLTADSRTLLQHARHEATVGTILFLPVELVFIFGSIIILYSMKLYLLNLSPEPYATSLFVLVKVLRANPPSW
jgi:Proteasome subunit